MSRRVDVSVRSRAAIMRCLSHGACGRSLGSAAAGSTLVEECVLISPGVCWALFDGSILKKGAEVSGADAEDSASEGSGSEDEFENLLE